MLYEIFRKLYEGRLHSDRFWNVCSGITLVFAVQSGNKITGNSVPFLLILRGLVNHLQQIVCECSEFIGIEAVSNLGMNVYTDQLAYVQLCSSCHIYVYKNDVIKLKYFFIIDKTVIFKNNKLSIN